MTAGGRRRRTPQGSGCSQYRTPTTKESLSCPWSPSPPTTSVRPPRPWRNPPGRTPPSAPSQPPDGAGRCAGDAAGGCRWPYAARSAGRRSRSIKRPPPRPPGGGADRSPAVPRQRQSEQRSRGTRAAADPCREPTEDLVRGGDADGRPAAVSNQLPMLIGDVGLNTRPPRRVAHCAGSQRPLRFDPVTGRAWQPPAR